MNLTAPSRRLEARWIVVVLAAICAGLHIWDLPAAIPSVRHDLAMTLVQAGALLGVVQLAWMLGGLAVSLLAELAGERAACWRAWPWPAWDRRSVLPPTL